MAKNNTEDKTLIIKTALEKINNKSLPEAKLDSLKKAVQELNSKKISMLRLQGKVQKFSNPKKAPIYVYKMSRNDRILFSVVEGKNQIWDVVDLKAKKSILLSPDKQNAAE